MSLQKLRDVGALGLLLLAPFRSFGNETEPDVLSPSQGEELAYRMHQEGKRKTVQRERRPDLEEIIRAAEERADQQNLTCHAESISEIRFQIEALESITGYQVRLECEDAPGPGLASYFDVDFTYLATFGLAQ